MAGLGRKTWSPGDTLTASDVNGYLMEQSVMVFAGTAARASAIPTPSAGMVAYSTATQLQVYDGSAWVDVGGGYGVATGGASTAITVSSIDYTLLSFTTDTNLVVSKAGLFDVLMFAGGGGGGGGRTATPVRGGGGGGAGGYVLTTLYLPAATYAVTVGAGGAGGADGTGGTNGGSSRIGAVLGVPGGAGGNSDVANSFGLGGSGGGGGGITLFVTPIAAQFGSSYGSNGGTGVNDNAGGGGGGATAVGTNAVTATGGNGGAGYQVNTFISGASLFKAGGGGGGAQTTAGTGGSSIGGAGAVSGAAGTAAANTASGGGGARNTATSGAGGSGIIYVRFKV